VLGRIFPGKDLEKPDLDAWASRAEIRAAAREQRRAEIHELQERQSNAVTMPEWSQGVRARVRGSSVRRLQNACSYTTQAVDLLGATVGVAFVMGVAAMVTGSVTAALIFLTCPVSIPGVAIEGRSRGATVAKRFKARVAATQHLR
jgi:hypothetical protein